MKASETVLHPLYGIGKIHAINPEKKMAFVRFLDREMWDNKYILGGWFSLNVLAVNVITWRGKA